ncbi:MAG TPA: hypothetical protein VJY63_00945 [Marinospirillum sp.]|uniref:hypothetical protein n=1 Tax=Marinospirillum sp. TaxID=2183934 RepID=UPI002B49367F|nr:hypothetical protein [Marinospirillum sp.]HKM14478.1 hypothetical protein [Marinospirillum sp.]
MALTKAQVSLVTVATLGVAPGGYAAELQAFNTQKEAAAFIATTGLLNQGTNAEFALQVAENLGASSAQSIFNALEAGASRADAAVDFANAQLVAQGGNIANVEKAIASTSTSTDLAALKDIVTPVDADLVVKFTDTEEDQTTINPNTDGYNIYNVGKAQLDAGASKISADFTFELKNQIGEGDAFEGLFLSPIIERQAAESSGSQLFLELLDLRAAEDGKTPLERVPVDTFAFTLNGAQVLIQSDAIFAAQNYDELFEAVKARIEELGQGVNVPATDAEGNPSNSEAYAKLANFNVTLGNDFTVQNQAGDAVSGTSIVLTDTKGATLKPLGFVNKTGVIPDPGYTLYAQLDNVAPTTITKLISTNLDADNVGYGSQGATVNLAGQSASDKGVEEIKVTATNNVWFTKLESKAATDHLARIELQSGSNGYFNVGTQKGSSVTSLVNENFNSAGLVDVQQVIATNASSTAINSFVSEDVLSRYEFEDTGIYTADDSKAAITYNLSSGKDVLNLAIDTEVLEAVDTQVNVSTGAGNDVITVAAVNDLGGMVQVATNSGGWLTNQQLNNNITINAGNGNDWILTPGAGNATINAGAGNDVVRTDNEGSKAVLVFNNATTDVNELIAGAGYSNGLTSNSDAAYSAGANNVAQTYNLFQATVKVSFKGFESDAIVIDSTDYKTSTLQINQAIKAAVNNDAVLSKLIAAHDNDGNALAIESLIDGGLNLSDLNIQITAPNLADLEEDEVAKLDTSAANTLNNGVYNTEFATETGFAMTGSQSVAESDNVINLGTGSDVLVMGTGANSNDTLKLTGYENGTNTVVSYNDNAASAGRDFLDFSDYNAGTVVLGSLNQTFNAEKVAKIGLTAEQFATLETTGLQNQLTGNAGDNQINGLQNLTAGNSADYVLMVENGGNLGEFTAYHLKANENVFTSSQKIGTLDFGSLKTVTDPTDPTDPNANVIDVAVVAEGSDLTLNATDEADIFKFTAEEQPDNAVNTITITNFSASDSVDLSAVEFDSSALGVLDPSFNNKPYTVALDGNNLSVTLFDGATAGELDTWVLTFENVEQAIVDAVAGITDVDAAVTAVTDVWGADWLIV